MKSQTNRDNSGSKSFKDFQRPTQPAQSRGGKQSSNGLLRIDKDLPSFRYIAGGGMAALYVLTFLIYQPAWGGAMLWDDSAHITRMGLRSWSGLGQIWGQMGATQQYYPVLHSFFWVQEKVWGERMVGYHITNIFLHTTAACLAGWVVYFIFQNPSMSQEAVTTFPSSGKRFLSVRNPVVLPRGQALAVAGLSAVLFAWHPIAVETVAWVSEQKNTLSACFYLGAFLWYLRFDRTRKPMVYAAAYALFLAAILSKSVTSTFPAAVLLSFWWRGRRLRWIRDVRPLLPFFATGLAGGLGTAWVEQHYFINVQNTLSNATRAYDLSAWQRTILAGRTATFYLGKVIWPINFQFFYPRWQVNSSQLSQYSGLAVIVFFALALGWIARRWGRGAFAGWLYFLGTLFPALGFFNVYPFRFSFVADHFCYLATLGIIIPICGGTILWARGKRLLGRGTALVLMSGGMIFLGLASHGLASNYATEEVLYTRTLATNPDAWLAHLNLALIQKDRPQDQRSALGHFQRAVELNPEDGELHNQLATGYAEIAHDLPASLQESKQAVQLSPTFALARLNLGITYLRSERLDLARVELREAIRLSPENSLAHAMLGFALVQSAQDLGEGIREYRTALRMDPQQARVHTWLGIALAGDAGTFPEALGEFRTAVTLEPGSASAHYNLANALERVPGSEQEARAEFAETLRLDPGNEGAMAHLHSRPR